MATHQGYEDALAARGDVTVVRDARYVGDGNLVTSQGVSASIDTALWLIGRVRGRPHARVRSGATSSTNPLRPTSRANRSSGRRNLAAGPAVTT